MYNLKLIEIITDFVSTFYQMGRVITFFYNNRCYLNQGQKTFDCASYSRPCLRCNVTCAGVDDLVLSYGSVCSVVTDILPQRYRPMQPPESSSFFSRYVNLCSLYVYGRCVTTCGTGRRL